jgi:hypothetical protein
MDAADQKNIIELVMNSPGRGFSFLKVNSIAGAVVKRIGPRRPWSRTGPRKADRASSCGFSAQSLDDEPMKQKTLALVKATVLASPCWAASC